VKQETERLATNDAGRARPTNAPAPGERCLCNEIVRATEAAAVASGRWMGQGDGEGAQAAARDAMHASFTRLPISATVVIGDGVKDQVPRLFEGEQVGAGGFACDLAVDSLQARDSLARGENGAMAVLAVADPSNMMAAPDIYMQKMVVGGTAAPVIDIDAPVTDNLQAIAEALERNVGDLTIITLDRPRHEDLIAEIRRAGARIRLIPDGDISAGIAAAVQGTGDHAYIGIGGTSEGIITAAAMRCLGGEIQGKFWPLSRKEVEQARERGIEDIELRVTTDDMVRGEVIFAATAVTRGNFLRGVDYFRDGARSHTLVMCTRCRNIRFVDTTHLFTDDRRQIRL